MRTVYAIIATAGRAAGVPLKGVAVWSFTDPEEGWTKLTCTVKVDLTPEQGLAFWDYVGEKIDAWRQTLSDEESETVVEQLAIYVDWQ